MIGCPNRRSPSWCCTPRYNVTLINFISWAIISGCSNIMVLRSSLCNGLRTGAATLDFERFVWRYKYFVQECWIINTEMVLKLIKWGRNKNKEFLPVFGFPNKLFYVYIYFDLDLDIDMSVIIGWVLEVHFNHSYTTFERKTYRNSKMLIFNVWTEK